MSLGSRGQGLRWRSERLRTTYCTKSIPSGDRFGLFFNLFGATKEIQRGGGNGLLWLTVYERFLARGINLPSREMR